MNETDFYLTHDIAASRRTMYLSVGIGALVGGIAEGLGATLPESAVACVLATACVEMRAIVRYKLPAHKAQREMAAFPIRRHHMVQAGLTLLFVLFLMFARIPGKAMAAFERQLQQAAADPTLSSNSQKANKVLEEAHAVKIAMSSDIVAKTGTKFIEASDRNNNAWETARQYLDYRSFLNKDFVPEPRKLTPLKESGYRTSVNIKPKPQPNDFTQPILRAFSVTFAGGNASPENSAKLETFDRPQTDSSGVGLIVIDGGFETLGLDGMYMKNVIVRNSDVAYDGGRVKLENVYFVNCKFQLQRTPSTIVLGKSMLASGPVNFEWP